MTEKEDSRSTSKESRFTLGGRRTSQQAGTQFVGRAMRVDQSCVSMAGPAVLCHPPSVVRNEDGLRPSSRELGTQAIRRAGTRNATPNEASGQKPQPSSRAALLL